MLKSKHLRVYERNMAKIGYARVSSTGQSLEVQLDRLNQVGCEKIYREKRSGKTAARPEFKNCMSYLRDGDTLIITRLDRLARSVVHLSQVAERFKNENINLVVTDQSIDTSTSTGRLMFNMLATIAEFETDLRAERQLEGINKAKENGVKFGRPSKRTVEIDLEIYINNQKGKGASELAKTYGFGVSTIHRIIATIKKQNNLGCTEIS